MRQYMINTLIANGVSSSESDVVLAQVLAPLVLKIKGAMSEDLLDQKLRLAHFNRPYVSYHKVRIWNEGYLDACLAMLNEIENLRDAKVET